MCVLFLKYIGLKYLQSEFRDIIANVNTEFNR